MNKEKMIKELVKAYNAISCDFDVCDGTNFTVCKMGNDLHLVASFSQEMSRGQCSAYLRSIPSEVVYTMYGIDVNDPAYQNVVKNIFDDRFFPTDLSKCQWIRDHNHNKFVIPIGQGMLLNLKRQIAALIMKDVNVKVLEKISAQITSGRPDDNRFLRYITFSNQQSRKQFKKVFSLKYQGFLPEHMLVKGGKDRLYIKDIFDNVDHLQGITRFYTHQLGDDIARSHSKNSGFVKLFKNLINGLIAKSTGVKFGGFISTSSQSTPGRMAFLIPSILSDGKLLFLTKDEKDKVNQEFGFEVFTDIRKKILAEQLLLSDDGPVYGIDFSNSQTSYHVINKIIEDSVIRVRDGKYELGVNYDALISRSPSIEPGCSGYKTPPRNRNSNCDSGFEVIPPKKGEGSGAVLSAKISKEDENAIRGLLRLYRNREEREELALRFKFPDDQKIKPLKNAIITLIRERTGIKTYGFSQVYDPRCFKCTLMTRDSDTSELRSINREEAQKIYKEFSHCSSLILYCMRTNNNEPCYFACPGINDFISEVERNLQIDKDMDRSPSGSKTLSCHKRNNDFPSRNTDGNASQNARAKENHAVREKSRRQERKRWCIVM